MKAFLLALAATAALSVAAIYALDSLGRSSASVFASDAVRLD